ncbi:T9SS type A sorting domain-containing protein [Flavisolibacter ginsenosidimutans]|nr:T9SS type A sorting domain-containing protein [Flavisolibacter ginsenosidimutans]
MATSVLNFLKKNTGKALLGASLLASNLLQAQTGNAIAGYDYLGSCMVSGQPHYYYVSKGEALWPAANTAAMTIANGQGYLATLTSQGENDCVYNLYKTYLITSGLGQPSVNYTPGNPAGEGSYYDKRNPWIGLTDQASEGTFLWSNGENCSDFRNWDCGTTPSPFNGLLCEPNNVVKGGNSNGEDYVQLLAFGDGPDNSAGGLGRKHQGFWNDWFNTESQLYIVEFGPNTCLGNEGCTPGFWKNHPAVWPASYSANDLASMYFTFPNGTGSSTCNLTSFGSQTLMQSLQGGGGPGINGAVTILIRAAVAGLLNAADPRVDYPLSPVQLQNMVNAALATCDRNQILALGTTIDGYNNLGCPIDAHGNPTTTSRSSDPASMGLSNAFTVSGYPNPSRSSFNIQVSGVSTENVSIRVTDMTGRLIEQRTSVPANQTIQIGSTYRAGLYYIEVSQGAAKQQLKMVKQ